LVQLDNATVVAVDKDFFTRDMQVLSCPDPLPDDVCDSVVLSSGKVPTVLGKYNSSYWLHDPWFALKQNTLKAPMPDGGGALVESTTEDGGGGSPFTAKCGSSDEEEGVDLVVASAIRVSSHPDLLGRSHKDLESLLGFAAIVIVARLTLDGTNRKFESIL
jgi:hypothetical protein